MTSPITSPAEDGAGRTNEHRIRDLQWLVAYLDHTCAVRPLTEKDIRQLIAAESRAAAAEAEVARLKLRDQQLGYRVEAAEAISEALRERVKVLEEANRQISDLLKPVGDRPCDCTRCDCGNTGDAQSVAAWDEQKSLYDAARAALTQGAPNADAP